MAQLMNPQLTRSVRRWGISGAWFLIPFALLLYLVRGLTHPPPEGIEHLILVIITIGTPGLVAAGASVAKSNPLLGGISMLLPTIWWGTQALRDDFMRSEPCLLAFFALFFLPSFIGGFLATRAGFRKVTQRTVESQEADADP